MKDSLHILPLNKWIINDDKPLIIAGPCSAESEEQVLFTAKEIAKNPQIKVFRAGVWKPRTRPKMFEGMGSEALLWLKRVKEETSLLTAVEVANPRHIEECLKNNIDIIWIGARTTVNPFSVQELAEALKGVDIPVMIKNPVQPDLQLWIGVIERIYQAGINKIIAIHRGFQPFYKNIYRNEPLWDIPIELKRQFPQLPIICDPSHIAGNTNLIAQISQTALDLEMNGLMIETHYNPQIAITDAKQQLLPSELDTILQKLVLRNNQNNQSIADYTLEQLRAEIDKCDKDLLISLAKRMKIVDEIGKYKKEHNVTILQIQRWKQMLEERLQFSNNIGLDTEFLLKLMQLVHDEAIQRQNNIMNSDK